MEQSDDGGRHIRPDSLVQKLACGERDKVGHPCGLLADGVGVLVATSLRCNNSVLNSTGWPSGVLLVYSVPSLASF